VPVRAILIDPGSQQISKLKIPQNTNKQLFVDTLSRLIGCATLKFAWISYRTKIAVGEKPEMAEYFYLPGSPPISGKAVIVDFNKNGEFCDVSMSISEVTAGLRWGHARRASGRGAKKAASGLPTGSANVSVAGIMAQGAGVTDFDGAE
jgi:hypothetical protein